jgi:uncharacterized membrane protein/predicted transcriptional regulator
VLKGGLAGRLEGGLRPLPVLLLAAFLFLPGMAAAGGGHDETGASSRSAQYLLSIVPTNATKWVDPSTSEKSATYGFQIKNTGDSNFPYCDLQLFPWNFSANWSYNFIPSIPFEVSPGETRTVLLVIYPAADAEAKRYTFELKGNGTGAGTNSITINLDIRQYAGVMVKAPPPQESYPGETLEFNFTIINTGNGKDRFHITSIEASSSIVPYLKDDNNWTIELNPGESAVKTVEVPLPFDWRYTGDTEGVQITLTAVSELNSNCYDTNSTILRVSHVYDLSVGVNPPSAAILPGQQADFTVSVLNLGNGNDTVTLSARTTFPSKDWTISLGRERLDMAPGRTNTTTLRITPPYNALAGDSYIVTLTALSSGPPGDRVERTEYIQLKVLAVKGISVPQEHFPPPYEVAPGVAVEFPFSFTNTGNAPQSVVYNVSEAPAGWAVTVEPGQAISVRPGVSAGALLHVVPSSNFNQSPAGPHVVKVRLSDPEAGLLRELTFEVEVAPVRALELEPVGGASREVNLFVSGKLTVLLSLWNAGNAPDDINVALLGDYASWGRFDASFVNAGAGEFKVLRLDITVPATAVTTSIYPLTVRATSLGRPDLFVEQMLILTVRNFDPAELQPRLRSYPQESSLSITAGDDYTLAVSVLCTGSGIGNVSLRISGGEGLGLDWKITELPRDLGAGENHTFLVALYAGGERSSTARGTLTIQAVGEGVSAPPQTVSVVLQPAPRPRQVVSMEGLGIALGIFLALSGLAIGWNEVVLVAFLNLLLPLYVKLRREEVLDHYTRGKIHGYIIANPGEHYNSIKAQLRLKNGTLAYHLRVLEREGYVKTTRDGMFKRFYPMEALVPRRKSEFSAIQEIVLESIRNSPGANQNELARRMGVSSQVVNYHIRNLVAAGIVRLERDGRETRCYLTDS